VLLDNLGHARNLGTEGNHNALHSLIRIIGCMKDDGKDTLNRSKFGGDWMKRRYGMDSPTNLQEKHGEPQISLESPLDTNGGEKRKKRVQCGLKTVKGIYTLGTKIVR
jgi:hypothetical protein